MTNDVAERYSLLGRKKSSFKQLALYKAVLSEYTLFHLQFIGARRLFGVLLLWLRFCRLIINVIFKSRMVNQHLFLIIFVTIRPIIKLPFELFSRFLWLIVSIDFLVWSSFTKHVVFSIIQIHNDKIQIHNLTKYYNKNFQLITSTSTVLLFTAHSHLRTSKIHRNFENYSFLVTAMLMQKMTHLIIFLENWLSGSREE